MLEKYSFHTNSLVKTLAPLINCVIDDALLETMPDIDQPLLLFINIKNLIDPLLHFSHIFCSQSGSDLCWWVAKGPVKWTQVSRFRRLIIPGALWAEILNCWKIKNSPQISCMTCSSFWIRSTSWQVCIIEHW